MFKIGSYQFKSAVILAPMAGITDLPFRRLCRAFGAGLAFSEMLSTNPQVWHTEKTKLRLSHHEEAGIKAVQIAGSDPAEMAYAAQVNAELGAKLIDINMGCPAKKVNRKMAGSALLQYPNLVDRILTAVVNAVDIPITLKIRTGWDTCHRNYLDIAKIAENAGIQALTLHGRTRACQFNGEAEYHSIKAVKQQVSIPVIANGDIISASKAKWVKDYTQADAVMIGRGALGNPWIFQEIQAIFARQEYTPVALQQKYQTILQHIADLHQFYGEQKGYRIARKHIAWYLEQIAPDSPFKRAFNALTSTAEQMCALEDFFNSTC